MTRALSDQLSPTQPIHAVTNSTKTARNKKSLSQNPLREDSKNEMDYIDDNKEVA